MAVGEVYPVVDGVAGADRNLDPSPDQVVLEIVGETVGGYLDVCEMGEKPLTKSCRRGV